MFGLGIMPYISASIILQLLGTVMPALEKLRKEGEPGMAKSTNGPAISPSAFASSRPCYITTLQFVHWLG